MAIQFKEIRQYLARNVRLSICFEDGHYHDYLMVSDIPDEKYDDLYLFGIGTADVEFSRDIYAPPKDMTGVINSTKDDTNRPALEIVLYDNPRDIERFEEAFLLFKDLKPYLQIGKNFSVNYAIVKREDWSEELFKFSDDISEEYDEMYVYGIGMEDNTDETDPILLDVLKKREIVTSLNKRIVIVVSEKARA